MSKAAKRIGSIVNWVVIICLVLTSFTPKPVIASSNTLGEN